MRAALTRLIERFGDPALRAASVIPWSSPVPAFGNLGCSKVATLGLNPSDREFLGVDGRELSGEERRFHTLSSLGLERWTHAHEAHLSLIVDSCRAYFARNPYHAWFRGLDRVISGTGFSYYDSLRSACHLDLVPYATSCKWTALGHRQQSSLLAQAGDCLGYLLRDSPVKVLVLNGASVAKGLEKLTEVRFDRTPMKTWNLRRTAGKHVDGYAFSGSVNKLAGVELGRELQVLGYNHNIQSSFGVTSEVIAGVRRWITARTTMLLGDDA